MGAMREARRAGTIDATSVAPTPTTNDTMIVLGRICRVVDGRSMPNAFSRACSPTAMTIPNPSPTADMTIPTTSASSTTDRRTCRRAGSERPKQRELARPL